MVYPALLPLMRTPRLPAVDWTDAPADLNGLVRFAERRNLVSARVPSHFNWPLSRTWFLLTRLPYYRFLTVIQGGPEPTDTFQMAIDNIWKQGKISETVYKYVPVCYLLPTDYNLIFWTSGRCPPFTSMHCCKRVWKLPYTHLRRSSSIAATSSTMASLSSWIVMIRLQNTRSFRNPHRNKSGTVRSGDRAGQAMSPKLRTQVTRCCAF